MEIHQKWKIDTLKISKVNKNIKTITGNKGLGGTKKTCTATILTKKENKTISKLA